MLCFPYKNDWQYVVVMNRFKNENNIQIIADDKQTVNRTIPFEVC